MGKLRVFLILLFASSAQAQSAGTIEGFWQDVAGRTTFKRNAPPTSTYGSWNERELDATYPQAKEIRKSVSGFELAELNYEEKEYSLLVLYSDASRIAYVRKANWSPCRVVHDCRLGGNEL